MPAHGVRGIHTAGQHPLAEADRKALELHHGPHELAEQLPSSSSPDWCRPFAELFREAGCDFYRIDRLLFSPARVHITALESGRSFSAGRLAPELLARSFGG